MGVGLGRADAGTGIVGEGFAEFELAGGRWNAGGVQGIGALGDFEAIKETVIVRIFLVHLGSPGHFVSIIQPVLVGIRLGRASSHGLFGTIFQSVLVSVCILGVGPGEVFIPVLQPVGVRIAVGTVNYIDAAIVVGIEPVGGLPVIRQSVAIGIQRGAKNLITQRIHVETSAVGGSRIGNRGHDFELVGFGREVVVDVVSVVRIPRPQHISRTVFCPACESVDIGAIIGSEVDKPSAAALVPDANVKARFVDGPCGQT